MSSRSGNLTDSIERRDPLQPNTLICAGGYVLRQTERIERGDECFYKECPHPVTCTTRHRH